VALLVQDIGGAQGGCCSRGGAECAGGAVMFPLSTPLRFGQKTGREFRRFFQAENSGFLGGWARGRRGVGEGKGKERLFGKEDAVRCDIAKDSGA
jgi:hypothetical protein